MKVSLKTLDGQEHSHSDKPSLECFRCGVCCQGYYPQLSPEELARMAADMHMTSEQFISKYVQVTKIGYLLRQEDDGCVFLGWETEGPPSAPVKTSRALCTIHAIRPAACRRWVATLSRRECREGLGRMQKEGSVLLMASDVYENREELEKFCGLLTEPDEKIST